jgi:hypothetical protein
MQEALEALAERGIYVNALRVLAFPFQDEIFDFVASHSKVFVVEQNRDAQLKTLLPLEIEKDGLRVSLFTVIATFGTAQDVTADELRIESLFPADEETETLFRAAAHP